MNRKSIISLIFLALIVLGLLNYYTKKIDFPYLEKYVMSLKENEEILIKIGKITNYEYTYNKNDLTNDTVPFVVQLYGKYRMLSLKGEMIRNNQDWKVTNVEKRFR